MKELFRGYIELKGKKAIEKFKDRDNFKTLEQARKLEGYAGILARDIIMIDVDDYEQSEKLMNLVEDLQLRCRVYETTRGKHFYFINEGVDSCRTKTNLVIGFKCDIKVGLKNSYDALKVDGKEREIIYDIYDDEEYEELPIYLQPIKCNIDFSGMSEGDGRNQTLFNYILTLQSAGYTKEEIRKTLRLTNKYVFSKPLHENELETILRDESFRDDVEPEFFNSKGTFLFDKFAKFIVEKYHVVKIDGQLHLYNAGVYVHGNSRIESLMIKHIPNLNKQKRNEVLSYMDILIGDNSQVSDAKYIAFKNGIYNIEDDSFSDFNPALIITNRINHNYNPQAYAEVVNTTLDNIACHDKQIRLLLEEVVGFCMYRRNELRKAFILTGDKRNGKSTFLDMIQKMLGDENTCALDLRELADRFKTAEMYGKLANIGDDIGDEFIANASVFKKIVSGNRVNAERKGQDPFDFNSYAKQLFSANDIPRIKDKSGAVIDRLIIVPFNATFSKTDPNYDPYIKYKLIQEESLEYLILVGLQGLKRVIKNQCFTTSAKTQKELEEYEEGNNPILMFFQDHEPEDFLNEVTAVVYQKYAEFCLANALQPLSNIEFSRQVKKKYGFNVITKSIKGKKYRVFAL